MPGPATPPRFHLKVVTDHHEIQGPLASRAHLARVEDRYEIEFADGRVYLIEVARVRFVRLVPFGSDGAAE